MNIYQRVLGSLAVKHSGETWRRVFDLKGKPKLMFHENEFGIEARILAALKYGGFIPDEIWKEIQKAPKNGIWSMQPVWQPNVYTNAGMAADAWRTIQDTGDTAGVGRFRYIAAGTSSTAEDATQTALGAEIVDSGLVRALATTLDTTTTTVTGDTTRAQVTFSVTGSKTVTEMGWFNAASGPTMRGRIVQTGQALQNGDSYQFTWSGRNSA